MVAGLPKSKPTKGHLHIKYMLALEMHQLAILHLIVVVAGATRVLGHPGAAGVTPLVHFWEKALPGTPVPEVIADLVQKGIDHSPLAEHYPVTDYGAGDVFFETNYDAAGDDIKRKKGWQRCRRCASEAKAGFYFRETQVRVGSTITFSFRPALVAPILPHDVAKKVPFGDLADVLATFDFAPSSAEAATVRDTLSQCQASPIDGEHKVCATSLEGTVQSAMHMLGGGTDDDDGDRTMLWAAASALPSTGLPLQPYVIQAVTPLEGDRHVGCHILPYPYAVYFCHMTPAMPTHAYLVSLRSSIRGGPAVTMAAICHLDTSNWRKAHPAFEMLRTQPGGVPVCHFMSYGNLLFGEKAVAATC